MINTIRLYYKKLKPREKVFAILFVAVITLTVYYRFCYKPFNVKIGTYKFQVQKSMTRLNELTSQFPLIDEQVEDLRLSNLKNEEILKQITDIGEKLPNKGDASRLTGEIVRLAKGLELVSIQQKIDEGEVYSRIFVELTFSASYKEIVDYIDKLETVSPFLKIEEMDITEPKGRLKGPGLSVRLLLSCLLGEAPVSEWLQRKAAEDIKGTPLTRDIFISRSQPAMKAAEIDLELQGITYNPQSPTAIINDEVVKVGSKINGLEVKEILPNSVIMTDGIKDNVLHIER